jgi:uroporphyrinogen decarboxylase
MNSLERTIAALQFKKPDRVPIFELMIDPGIIEAMCPGCSYLDFVEEMDLDIVITSTPSSLYRHEKIPGKEDMFKTEWGEIRRQTKEIVPFPLEGPIKSKEDLNNYTPPDPLDPYRFEQLHSMVDRFKGKKAIAMHLHDAFSYPTYLRGMTELMMDIVADPDMVKELVKLSVEHTKVLIKRAIEIGAEIILFGDDYGGTGSPIISPHHFEEFFLPGMKEVVSTVKENSGYAIKHTDGNINSILGMMVETGIDAIHPLDPIAGMDIKAVKDKYKICVIGNIDTTKLLSKASPEEVRKVVKEIIDKVAPGGGYIISSSNTIHSGVKPENYAAMLETAKRYGKYN